MTKVGINGFGRIGRQVLKSLVENYAEDLEVVAINDLFDTKANAHLFKYDSTYGTFKGTVDVAGSDLVINGKNIKVFNEKDPANIPWKDLGVEIVIESTGIFTDALGDPAKGKAGANAHLKAGAKKVIISAPAKNEDITVVMGVNHTNYDPAKHFVVSNASCTTNCLAPLVAVLLKEGIGVEEGLMTTVHSYTASQKLQDAPAKDIREARAAAENIVPTTTGASKAAALTIPSLQGHFNGLSVRVPTPVVSLSDITAVTKRDTSIEEINELFKKAAADPYYQGILDATEEELVSIDYRGNSHSSIVDLKLTDVVDGNLIKVVAWYDNEWGYSNKVLEMAKVITK